MYCPPASLGPCATAQLAPSWRPLHSPTPTSPCVSLENASRDCEQGRLAVCCLLDKQGQEVAKKGHSVQFSRSVVFDSLQPHGPQHARPPCPSRTPRVYTNSSPLSWWCHPTISFSVVPFSSCLQSFLASRSFQMSQLFVAKVLEFQLQHQSFQWIFRIDFL